ncbi:MAG: KEOPS complex subunit Pcc1 [Halobacteriales archaeon]
MSFPHDLTLTATYDDPERARTVGRSLAEEIGEIDDDRSRTGLDRDGADLTITVDATDPVALRAASNTWLSLLSVAETTTEIGERAGIRHP